jgi:hypothetical protein
LKLSCSPHSLRPLLVCLSLVSGMVAALAILLLMVSPVQAQEELAECQTKLTEKGEQLVPDAEKQDPDCVPDMTTKFIQNNPDWTRQDDWRILSAAETSPSP